MLKIIFIILLVLLLILYIIVPLAAVIMSFVRPKGGYNTDEKVWKNFIDANKEGIAYLKANKLLEDVYITSFDGLKLRGQFVDNNSKNTIIFVHGYQAGGGLSNHAMSAKYFANKDTNYLYVDNRAHGKSEGRVIGFAILDYKDILSWIDYLNSRIPNTNIVLYGISMGAATVLNAAGDKNLPANVKGVIADCPYSSGYDEVKYLTVNKYHIPSSVMFMTDVFMKLICGYHLKDAEPKERIKNCKIPLLLIHGDEDRFVPTYMSKEIYDNASCPKNRVLFKGARHATSYILDKKLYEDTLDEFFKSLNN